MVWGIGAAVLGLAAPDALAGTLYTHAPVTLHGGPGESFPVRGSLRPRAKIEVLWCNSATDWCLVEHDAGEGWLPMSMLVPAGEPRSKAAETAAPASSSGHGATRVEANAGSDHIASPAGAGATSPTISLSTRVGSAATPAKLQ